MSLSLSNLFAAAPAAGAAAGGLFSESAKQKFARVYKPEEFDIPTKKVPEPLEDEGDDVEPLDAKKKKRKERKRKPVEGEIVEGATPAATEATEEGAKGADGDLSTIFVGNVPVSETTKSLTKYFKVYGEIESIRLRSVPVAGAKVDEAGNQDLVKKVCVNAKKFGEQKGSFNAYIKFKEAASATAALAANNQVMGIRHIRVDRSTPSLFDPKRSVFLGGLPHYADEEDIRDFFAEVGLL
jgi:nucleolar protein 12